MMISAFIWPDAKTKDVKVISDFQQRLPQQENGSDCGIFMLEFMLRAYHDFLSLTDFLSDEAATENSCTEPLFTSQLILKRRD